MSVFATLTVKAQACLSSSSSSLLLLPRARGVESCAVGLNARRCSAPVQDVCVRVVRQENGPAIYQQRPES